MCDALGTTGQLKDPAGSIDMFELLAYERFRDTPSVRFFDVTVDTSNARDLVIHSGPAVSPPNDPESGAWQSICIPIRKTICSRPVAAEPSFW